LRVAFSSQGTATVISCAHSVWLRSSDAAAWRVVTRSKDALDVWELALDDRDHVVVGFRDGTIQIWDASRAGPATADARREIAGNLVAMSTGHTALVSILEIRGDTMLSISWDRTLRRWAFPSGKPLGRILKSFDDASISPSGQWVATVEGSAAVSLWDSTRDRVLEQIPTAEVPTNVVFVDEDHVVVGGEHGRLELIDLSEKPRALADMMKMIKASPRWKIVDGEVVEQH
jgi:WD40 repeat protein